MKKSFKKQGAIELAVGQDGCSVEVFLNGQWIAQMVKDDVWKSILFGRVLFPVALRNLVRSGVAKRKLENGIGCLLGEVGEFFRGGTSGGGGFWEKGGEI